MSEPHARRDQIEAEAAEWVVRLDGDPLGPAERRALEGWLRRSPLHKAAFEEAETAWVKMATLRHAPGALAADIVRPRPAAPSRVRPRVLIQAGGIAAVLVLAVGALGLQLGDPLTALSADHRTGTGESRAVTLPDGSLVELGPASAIALRYTDEARRVELLSGQAYFTAAPAAGAERRPFVVAAADGTARALGTQFMVERLPSGNDGEAVEVTVAEHDVEVAAPAAAGTKPVVLSPGQTVRYDAASGLGAVRRTRLDQATAWRRGRLIFDQRPLGAVVAELNRYRRDRIVLADSALAGRTVSGVFEAGNPDAALRAIAGELGLRTVSLPLLVTVLY